MAHCGSQRLKDYLQCRIFCESGYPLKMPNSISAFPHGSRAVNASDCMLEVRSADENWSGLSDPVLRRKLQNRLNQRTYRMLSLIN